MNIVFVVFGFVLAVVVINQLGEISSKLGTLLWLFGWDEEDE